MLMWPTVVRAPPSACGRHDRCRPAGTPAPIVTGMATTRPTAASVRERPARRAGRTRRDRRSALDRRAVGAADGEPSMVGRRSDRLTSRSSTRPHRGRSPTRIASARRSPISARPSTPTLAPTRSTTLTLGAFRAMSPAELLAAWRANRRAARRRRSDTRRRHPGHLVRPVDGCQVVSHRTADGVLGARPTRRRRGRGGTHADRSAPAHRAARVHHPQLDLPQPWVRRAGCSRTRRARSPRRAERGPSARTTPRSRSSGPPSISASSSRSAATSTPPTSSSTGDDARDWMTKAQAFAGSATDGPPA